MENKISSEVCVPETEEEKAAYQQLESLLRARIEENDKQLFTTDVDTDLLVSSYLMHLPADRAKHYTCHTCFAFIRRYGGLVTVNNEGKLEPFLWAEYKDVPLFFRVSCEALFTVVSKAKITGVFLSSEETWGTPVTGVWTHLSGCPCKKFTHPLLTASQAMAEKKQDYLILVKSLDDYSLDLARRANFLLRSDMLFRSEKARDVGAWFVGVHESLLGLSRKEQGNLLWLQVAHAPAGYCHIRSSVISTLLDDLKAGLEVSEIRSRWQAKLHPLAYQRPQAAPSVQTIEQAEKTVEKLGVTTALRRRFARKEDVLKTCWVPVVKPEPVAGGVFAHLKKKPTIELDLPSQTLTWEKFSRTILPDAVSMEVFVPEKGNFYGLTTASDPTAAPILQWDGLNGHPRNPVAWYFYSGLSHATRWNLKAGSWAKVTSVFLSPHCWQEPGLFLHHQKNVFFSLEGAVDLNINSLGLFPETLKNELRAIRSVIEAHSLKSCIEEPEKGEVNGIAISSGASPVNTLNVRVRTEYSVAVYKIDRFD